MNNLIMNIELIDSAWVQVAVNKQIIVVQWTQKWDYKQSYPLLYCQFYRKQIQCKNFLGNPHKWTKYAVKETFSEKF